tara:strand:+ start:2865 stop:4844 length:1980 start_codon:yes stop_codon:yes gene_type:complete
LKTNIHAIIQARLGSKRYKNKVLTKIYNNETTLSLLIKRLSKSKILNKIIFAIPKNKNNDKLYKYLNKFDVSIYRGSEKNVFKRFLDTAKFYNSEIIVRLTGDCIFIDTTILDNQIYNLIKYKYDFITNTNPQTFPDGLDFEIFNFQSLQKSNYLIKTPFQKEHVTPVIKYSGKFKTKNVKNKTDLSEIKLSLDTLGDFNKIKTFITENPKVIDYNWQQLQKIILKNKNNLKQDITEVNNGNVIWNRAKKIIPGGSMVYSKRQENFVKASWPTYFKKTKGYKIWGIDGNIYTDLSLMGLGTNSLGYSNTHVDRAVKTIVSKGNLSTLNAPEEVYLAEKLISMHDWADMVRFTRTGGEANAVAIRLARATNGLDKVAVCGYHGWHDWYLSGNISKRSNLDNHLFKNVNPGGVPSNLKNTSLPFKFNNFQDLENIVNNHKISAVKMEVSRDHYPKKDYLNKIRKLTKKKNIILIFDECTSGFRETYGGLHLKFNVKPDVLILGKALGNGYAINAILGKKEVMKSFEKTFISSTFWTERIGSSAALATLEQMSEQRSWEIITKLGKNIKNEWVKIAKDNNLPIEIKGLDALCEFEILSKNFDKYKKYITKEFLKHKILAKNKIYLSTSHAKFNFDHYFNILNSIFKDISNFESNKKNLTLDE